MVDITEGKEVSLTPKAFAEAHGLLQQMKTLNFHFELICWQHVLNTSDTLSKYLQSGPIDVTAASNLIEGFKERMSKLHYNEDFEEIKNAANSSLQIISYKRKFCSRKFPTIDENRMILEMANILSFAQQTPG